MRTVTARRAFDEPPQYEGQLVHYARPWTLNAERTWHPMKRHETVKLWRTAFAWLAMGAKIPKLDSCIIIAQPEYKDRRGSPDVGACFGAVKAAIDGIVDAGVLVDDRPDRVMEIRMTSPVFTAPRSALRIVIRGERA